MIVIFFIESIKQIGQFFSTGPLGDITLLNKMIDAWISHSIERAVKNSIHEMLEPFVKKSNSYSNLNFKIGQIYPLGSSSLKMIHFQTLKNHDVQQFR